MTVPITSTMALLAAVNEAATPRAVPRIYVGPTAAWSV